jgi:hypothetical protein
MLARRLAWNRDITPEGVNLEGRTFTHSFNLREAMTKPVDAVGGGVRGPWPRRLGFQPGDPCPDLMTEQEAIRYLRLDEIEIKSPEETLRRYRKEGQLRGTQVSKRVFYLRSELDLFLKKITADNPR